MVLQRARGEYERVSRGKVREREREREREKERKRMITVSMKC